MNARVSCVVFPHGDRGVCNGRFSDKHRSNFERQIEKTHEIRARFWALASTRATRSATGRSLSRHRRAFPAVMASSATPLQLLTGDGELQEGALASFLAHNGAEQWNRHYRVVAVMGPQSSGKSTLMNHVFGTTFKEMDHERGRSQTTRGVWLARASKPDSSGSTDANRKQRPTLVMDLEGTDGRERGEDDTAFEKQTALFAMATADVLMVNMWCNDLGREVASGKPLLKVVFQVNLRLFTPRKTTLLFVIRDKSRTPEARLKETLVEDLSRIWDGIAKPERHASSSFDDFFRLEFVALSHFEHARDAFVADCDATRSRFFVDAEMVAAGIPAAELEPAAVPASGLAVSLREAWRAVRENRDLDLPAHGVMVATVRCEEIARERVQKLAEDDAAGRLAKLARDADVDARTCGLGEKTRETLREHLEAYDEESKFFDERIAAAKREGLARALGERLVPATETRLAAVAARLAEKVGDAMASSPRAARRDTRDDDAAVGFAERAEAALREARERWNAAVDDASPSKAREDEAAEEADEAEAASSRADVCSAFDAAVTRATDAFERAIGSAVASARAERVAETVRGLERALERSVGAAVSSALDDAASDLWDGVNAVAAAQHERHVRNVADALREFGLDAGDRNKALRAAASKTFEAADAKTRDAARDVADLMKRAFSRSFCKDSRGLPKTWRASDDVARANALAQREAARVLALVAVSRLRDPGEAAGTGKGSRDASSATRASSEREREARSHAAIEKALVDALVPSLDVVDEDEANAASAPSAERSRPAQPTGSGRTSAPTPRLPMEWAGEDPARVLLDPGACRDAWRTFESDIAYSVSQALAAQAAAARGGAPNAPAWMYAALIVAGADEAFWLLRHPFTTLFLALVFLFARAVVRRLDVETAMRMGVVPGIMFLATRVVPAATQVLARLMEEGRDAHGLAPRERAEQKRKADAEPDARVPAEPRGAGSASRAPAVSADGMKRRVGGASMDPTAER